eukprot:CAMPEP_0174263096 /NCGR_PEP_ID=MMETSP0439-20130205/17128_1 /TAXON_ID=0 /ORGANISM="Stereomyxa ramosa, Strain Chinc5" /LENGTH=304 /DNA_ID=CAMNT_0015348243 /DNA_START=54 /DNA_END=965 /DNA_ORIENTATION=+
MRAVANRMVIRISREVKRTYCKKCNTLLIPGISAIVRLKSKRQDHLVVTCSYCSFIKRYPTTSPLLNPSVQQHDTNKGKEKEESEALLPPLSEPVQDRSAYCEVKKGMLMRLLYTNPVCLMTTYNPVSDEYNIMPITWITSINNHGVFFCSMNQRRHTCSQLQANPYFVLNVPVEGMEEVVRKLGGCSGREVNKLSHFQLPICHPGWFPIDSNAYQQFIHNWTPIGKYPKEEWYPSRNSIEEGSKKNVGIESCVAHLECKVMSSTTTDYSLNHNLLHCLLYRAWVKTDYWSGNNFIPQDQDVPP